MFEKVASFRMIRKVRGYVNGQSLLKGCDSWWM